MDLKKLQQQGLRNTQIRKELLKIFQQSKVPIPACKLRVLLKNKGLTPSRTTIYRQIKTLVEQKLLNQVMIKAQIPYYEMVSFHHHHFTCDRCKQITCINDEKLEKQIFLLEEQLKKKGLHPTEHHFSFNGICDQCH